MRQARALLGIVLLAAAGPASAFETVPVPSAESDAGGKRAPPPAGPATQLQGQQDTRSSSGTKRRGWGLAPKLDFGLELMYGARQQETPAIETPDDDVMVLGTVKRRF